MEENRRAFRLSDGNDRAKDPGRWAKIFANPPLLIHTIIILQRTLRLAQILATWEGFMQTEYYFDLARNVDSSGLKLFREWWGLIADVAPGRDMERNEAEFILACLVARKMAAGYGKAAALDPGKFNLSEEDGERIKDLAFGRYNSIVK
jgi:hypothetical protein